MRLIEWIEDIQRNGRYTFTYQEAKITFPDKTAKAIDMSLFRLMQQGAIQSAFKGFYTVIPIQYQNLGGLPPAMYINDLMKYLERDYYISHLSAAALHGSAHQQPQEFYVTHNKSALRKTKKGVMRLNFIKKESWNCSAVERKKSDAGYILVSNPLQTAFDLVNDHNKIGGINRAATIINEMVNLIKYDKELIKQQKQVTLQRLGFILDDLNWQNEADELYNQSFKMKKPKNRYPLKSGKLQKGYSSRNRWNIVENTSIEIDE